MGKENPQLTQPVEQWVDDEWESSESDCLEIESVPFEPQTFEGLEENKKNVLESNPINVPIVRDSFVGLSKLPSARKQTRLLQKVSSPTIVEKQNQAGKERTDVNIPPPSRQVLLSHVISRFRIIYSVWLQRLAEKLSLANNIELQTCVFSLFHSLIKDYFDFQTKQTYCLQRKDS